MNDRPSWSDYFMNIAKAVATRSDCERDKVGAVIVKDRRIRSTGYNGSPAGHPGCQNCPRRSIPAGSTQSYDNCVALHAEQNAIIYCDREDMQGATIYVTRMPCVTCMKLIMGSGIMAVQWPGMPEVRTSSG
jgi:dCMP deaminase